MTEAEIGTQENPYLVAPEDWHEDGVFYGAFCRCSACGLVARSTITFDFYAKEVGDPLRCETCTIGTPYAAVEPVIKHLEKEGAFDAKPED